MAIKIEEKIITPFVDEKRINVLEAIPLIEHIIKAPFDAED